MSKVLLCMGNYAETPYFVEKAYVNVYSIEELCYCLMQKVHLIDREIMAPGLTGWLEKECGLKELSDELAGMIRAEKSVSEYAGRILRYTGYGTDDEIERMEVSLRSGAGLSMYEKKKTRADYFAEGKKYMLAIRNYDTLLEELPETERELKAKVYHNRGAVQARLFQFEAAAHSFKQAYDCDGAEESYISFLAAKRLRLDETEYVDFAAAQEGAYEISLKVEERMEHVKKEFDGTEESRMLFTLQVCREENHSVSYYEEIERITGELKEQYRDNVAR